MDRRLLLHREPASVGAAWARLLCDSVVKQGRPIAGGWPGTIVEARARIARHLQAELAARRMPPPSQEELTAAANVTYARAKSDWLEMERNSRRLARTGGFAEE